MDARKLQAAAFFVALFGSMATHCHAAESYQTVNFSVSAASEATASEVGKAAENYRRQLAIFWLGKPLPNWSKPCRIVVKEDQIGAGGRTTFQFVRGEVLNWSMEVQGSKERILDSVLPHEINHTIFACHFRRPLPRWADEGAATLFEHRSEQWKQLDLLNKVVRGRSSMISLRELLSMKKYPDDYRRMLTLYAQGYALADFLVQQKGRHAYLKFIADGEKLGWENAIKNNFDHDGIESLEKNWKGWILAGMPKLTLPRDHMLAATVQTDPETAARPEMPIRVESRPVAKLNRNSLVRSQSPDAEFGVAPSKSVPPNSDEAMPSRFLNAEPANSASVMPTRIEAPLPRIKAKAAGETQTNASLDTISGAASWGSSQLSERVAETKRSEQSFTDWVVSEDSVRNTESVQDDGIRFRVNSTELQPTSVFERGKLSAELPESESDFRAAPQTSGVAGSKPAWAAFPSGT